MAATKTPPAQKTDGLTDMLHRAMTGDASAIPELWELMKTHTGLSAVVADMGDLARKTEERIVDTAAGKNLLFKESMVRKLQSMRAELAGPNPTPLEKLLAERIALCWLTLHDTEVRLAQANDLTMRQNEHWQRRIDHAHRRYLTAIRTLATVRKLALPVVQVNIAKRQTNIAVRGAGYCGRKGNPTTGRKLPRRNRLIISSLALVLAAAPVPS